VDGLREVARRFLGAYAPATAEDLARRWMEARSARRAAPMLDPLGDEVIQVDVEGQPALALAADLPELVASAPRNVARLLPAFAPWVVAMARRAPMIDGRHVGRVYRQQGWVSPVILVNGQIAGVRRHTRTGRRLAAELEPFEPLPAWASRQLAAETRRLAEFPDCELLLGRHALVRPGRPLGSSVADVVESEPLRQGVQFGVDRGGHRAGRPDVMVVGVHVQL
jgi:hypothetical protein